MISEFFILNTKGGLVISKNIKDNLRKNLAEVFRIQVVSSIHTTTSKNQSPVLTLGSTSFIHLLYNDLFFVAVTRSNQDCSVILEFMHKFIDLLNTMLVVVVERTLDDEELSHGVNEATIKANFISVGEILDEVLDNGYPQAMEPDSLRQCLSDERLLKRKPGKKGIEGETTSFSSFLKRRSSVSPLAALPAAGLRARSASASQSLMGESSTPNAPGLLATSPIPWRREGIRYRRNEVFLDVHEEINLLMSATGQVLNAYIDGHIQMRAKLSGMPVCDIGLNDSTLVMTDSRLALGDAHYTTHLANCNFHLCVSLPSFEADRLIRFVPPDNERFELMAYRCQTPLIVTIPAPLARARLSVSFDAASIHSAHHTPDPGVKLPFGVWPTVTVSKNRVVYHIEMRSMYNPKFTSTNVELRIPLPKNVASNAKPVVSTTLGKTKVIPHESYFTWRFSRFVGDHEASLEAEFALTAPDPSQELWKKPPIQLQFEFNMSSLSGLAIKYLKVAEESNYSTVKWINYISKAGSYEIRY